MTISELVANEVDNDTPGVTVTGSPLAVNEGSSNTYTLVLDAQPSSNVTVTAARTSGGDTDLSLSGSPLTFTNGNWNTAQTLTVSAAEDEGDSANGSATFEHSASSGDSRYDGASVTISDLVANEVDNDTPGVTVTGSPLAVNEASSNTYTLVLDAQPNSNVTVTAAKKNGGDGDLSLSGSPLTFTDANWNTAQTLTVSAAEDGDTTNGSATFEHSASSGDSRYDGASITISDLVANEVDNDTAGVTVTGSPLGVNEGSSNTYTLVLTTQPSSNVTVTAARKTGGDTDLSLSGSPLTFTNTNWDTAQTLTVSAAEDDDTSTGSATFEHSASSGDSSYDSASITISELVANEVDNDANMETTLDAPTNLRAEPGDRQVRLSWDAVDGATEYEYQQRSSGSFGANWISTGNAATRTVVTGLNNGTQYTFRVRAVVMMSPRIEGPPSNPVSATPSSTPLNLIAIPGDQYVTLIWDPVPDVGEHDWLHCWWRYCHGTWFWERPTIGDDGRWSARVTGWDIGHGEPPRPSLTNGRTYTFYVTPCLAECHDLNERRDIVYGTPGGPVDVTPMPELSKTTGLTVTPGNGQVTLRWDAIDGATGWVYVQRSDGGQYGPLQKVDNPSPIYYSRFDKEPVAYTYTITGLDNNTRYFFEVGMTNGNCEGPQCEGPRSDEQSATPRAFLPPPANLRATPGDRQVMLAWDGVAGAAGYEWTVFDRFNNWREVPDGATSVTVGDRPNGVVHSFRVRTVHTVQVGTPAETVTIHSVPSSKVLATPLSNPRLPSPNLRVESGEGHLLLRWDWHGHNPAHPLVGATAYQYRIRRSADSFPSDADGGGWTSVGDIFKPPKTSHRVTGVSIGTRYHVQLRALNGTVLGTPSSEVEVVYGQSGATGARGSGSEAAPDAVASVTAVHRGSSLEVSWPAAARADHYHVTYTPVAAANVSWNLAASEHQGTSITITGVESATTYLVGVRAKNGAGASGWVNSAPAAPPALSVSDATVAEPGEGVSASLDFVVRLNRATTGPVTVKYGTSDGTATAGEDYTASSGTLTFQVGETEKTVSVPVLHDSHNEGSETMTFTLSNATGAVIDSTAAVATGTITNDDPIPAAWLARFGRTVAQQVLDAVEGRMEASATPGRQVVIAGIEVGGEPHADDGQSTAGFDAPRLQGSDLLSSSSFAITSETTAGELSWSLWGEGAVSSFDGRDDTLTLEGTVTTALLGADWTGAASPSSNGEGGGEGAWRAGFLLSHSTGQGSYNGTDSSNDTDHDGGSNGGKVKARLTGFFPWARRALNNRLAAWGLAGYGKGAVTVTPQREGASTDGAALKADLNLWLAAAGLRGTLLDGGDNGLTITGKTDAMVVGTSSGSVTGDGGNMAATQAVVTRLRMGLEASRALQWDSGVTLTPSLEVGLRHDGGDAETGFGVDLGGAIALAYPQQGVEATLRGRGLLSHAAAGFRDRGISASLSWQQQPDSHLGAALSLTQTMGGPSSGGVDALYNRTTLEGLAANDGAGNDDLDNQRLELKLSYGLPAFNHRFSLTPELELGLYDSGRDYRIGWRLTRLAETASFALSLDATRQESATSDGASLDHGIELRLDTQF